VIRTWTGLTTVCTDDLPVLGELPGLPGAYACVTHTGYTLGPICARILADHMRGRGPAVDIAPFLAAPRVMPRAAADILQGA
jgi:D-amino-acid dehydrogenase